MRGGMSGKPRLSGGIAKLQAALEREGDGEEGSDAGYG